MVNLPRTRGTKMDKKPIKTFDDFSEAFDYCREANAPVTVIVNGEKWQLFPSGRAERIRILHVPER